jgi:hypothetical protein
MAALREATAARAQPLVIAHAGADRHVPVPRIIGTRVGPQRGPILPSLYVRPPRAGRVLQTKVPDWFPFFLLIHTPKDWEIRVPVAIH